MAKTAQSSIDPTVSQFPISQYIGLAKFTNEPTGVPPIGRFEPLNPKTRHRLNPTLKRPSWTTKNLPRQVWYF